MRLLIANVTMMFPHRTNVAFIVRRRDGNYLWVAKESQAFYDGARELLWGCVDYLLRRGRMVRVVEEGRRLRVLTSATIQIIDESGVTHTVGISFPSGTVTPGCKEPLPVGALTALEDLCTQIVYMLAREGHRVHILEKTAA